MSDGLKIRYSTQETIVPSCLGVCFPDKNTYDKVCETVDEYSAGLKVLPDDSGAVYVGVHGRCRGYTDLFLGA